MREERAKDTREIGGKSRREQGSCAEKIAGAGTT